MASLKQGNREFRFGDIGLNAGIATYHVTTTFIGAEFGTFNRHQPYIAFHFYKPVPSIPLVEDGTPVVRLGQPKTELDFAVLALANRHAEPRSVEFCWGPGFEVEESYLEPRAIITLAAPHPVESFRPQDQLYYDQSSVSWVEDAGSEIVVSSSFVFLTPPFGYAIGWAAFPAEQRIFLRHSRRGGVSQINLFDPHCDNFVSVDGLNQIQVWSV